MERMEREAVERNDARIVLVAVVVSAADVVGWVGGWVGKEGVSGGKARRLGVQVAWMSGGK